MKRQNVVEFQDLKVGQVTFERYCLNSRLTYRLNGTSLSADSFLECVEMAFESGEITIVLDCFSSKIYVHRRLNNLVYVSLFIHVHIYLCI